SLADLVASVRVVEVPHVAERRRPAGLSPNAVGAKAFRALPSTRAYQRRRIGPARMASGPLRAAARPGRRSRRAHAAEGARPPLAAGSHAGPEQCPGPGV